MEAYSEVSTSEVSPLYAVVRWAELRCVLVGDHNAHSEEDRARAQPLQMLHQPALPPRAFPRRSTNHPDSAGNKSEGAHFLE